MGHSIKERDIKEVCLIWGKEQMEAVRALKVGHPDCVLLPLNPLAYGAVLQEGFCGPKPLSHWDYISKEQIEGLKVRIERSYQNWAAEFDELCQNVLHPLADLPLRELDHLPLWYWSQELCYYDLLLAGLEQAHPRIETLYFPTDQPRELHNWHQPVDLPLLAAKDRRGRAGWDIERIGEAQPLQPLSDPPLPEADLILDLEKPTSPNSPVLLHCLGVPELPVRLKALAKEQSAPLLLVLDEFFSGDLETIYQLAEQLGNVHILPLFGPRFARLVEGKRTDDNIILQEQKQLEKFGSPARQHLSRALIKQQWPRHLALKELFTDLFDRQKPVALVSSDHGSPEGTLLQEMASQHKIEHTMLAHSGWPLASAFALPAHAHSIYCGWTRQAVLQQGQDREGRGRGTGKVLPVRALYPVYMRPRHLAGRLKPSGKIHIGLVLTMEMFSYMPELLDGLRALLEAGQQSGNDIVFILRLRENVDDASMMAHLLADFDKLVIRSSADEPIISFFTRCQLVVEVGTQSSAMLECFAALTPYLRLGNPAAHHGRFDMPTGLVPILDNHCPQLQPFLAHRRQRLKLAARQHIWLLRQSAAGWFRSIL